MRIQPRPADLPDYADPPVIEVVVGVQFQRLEWLSTSFVGLFWQKMRSAYPKAQDMPNLAPVHEQFAEVPAATKTTPIEISPDLPLVPRVFFIDETGNWVLQLQADRLLHNWRRINEGDRYPRFETCFARFATAWASFLEFCREQGHAAPEPDQLEVTYINHVPARTAWRSLSELAQVFPDLGWRTTERWLPEPEAVLWRTTFELPERQGRLHVTLRHGIRQSDREPVLLCELTARGFPHTGAEDELSRWFGLAREWIVRGFADLAGDRIQEEVWRRRK